MQYNMGTYFSFLTEPQLRVCFLRAVWVFKHTNQPTAAMGLEISTHWVKKLLGKHAFSLNSWLETIHFISVSVHMFLHEDVIEVRVHTSLSVWRHQDGTESLPQSLWGSKDTEQLSNMELYLVWDTQHILLTTTHPSPADVFHNLQPPLYVLWTYTSLLTISFTA